MLYKRTFEKGGYVFEMWCENLQGGVFFDLEIHACNDDYLTHFETAFNVYHAWERVCFAIDSIQKNPRFNFDDEISIAFASCPDLVFSDDELELMNLLKSEAFKKDMQARFKGVIE